VVLYQYTRPRFLDVTRNCTTSRLLEGRKCLIPPYGFQGSEQLRAEVGHASASKSHKGMPTKPSQEKPKSLVLFPRACRFDAAVGGRVERWRGGLGFGLLLGQGFPVCGAISVCHAPFPPPAHRTGRADFPHPALRLASPSSPRSRLAARSSPDRKVASGTLG